MLHDCHFLCIKIVPFSRKQEFIGDPRPFYKYDRVHNIMF